MKLLRVRVRNCMIEMEASKLVIILLCLCGSVSVSLALNVVNIEVDNLLHLQKGLGWPATLTVSEGQEGLMKLRSVSGTPDSCTVITPTGVSFDVHTPPSNRYESWSEGCGLRVRNVVEADMGRWKLIAKKGTQSVVGWIGVFVIDVPSNYTSTSITIQDGEKAEIHLSTVDNSYCVVEQPFSESALVPGECKVTLDKVSRAVQGDWHVLLGVPGRVQEIRMSRHVAVEAEKLDFGYIHDTSANKLHLYCNIIHSNKNITLCRFQRTNSESGFNVVDGLGDGSHSYYGDGFLMRQCGITMEQPTSQDFGTWRCSVGSQQWDGSHIVPAPLMQALISVAASTKGIKRNAEDTDMTTVVVQENQSFTLMCRAKASLAYCWFQHPNGSQFTPVALVDDPTQEFWYTGESLQVGDCGITFNHAHGSEEGEWTCHMAPRDQTGIEVTDKINVRVTGPLAANKVNVHAGIGEQTTLYCHTANGKRALDYCRFLSPQFVGLSLDSTVSSDKAILGRYHYTSGRSLDYGDCSLTIDPVTADDVGEWTCAALITGDSNEARDTITLIDAKTNLSRASVLGLAIGIPFLAVILSAALVYKYDLLNTNKTISKLHRTRTQNQMPMDVLSTTTNVSRFSAGSSASEDSVTCRRDNDHVYLTDAVITNRTVI